MQYSFKDWIRHAYISPANVVITDMKHNISLSLSPFLILSHNISISNAVDRAHTHTHSNLKTPSRFLIYCADVMKLPNLWNCLYENFQFFFSCCVREYATCVLGCCMCVCLCLQERDYMSLGVSLPTISYTPPPRARKLLKHGGLLLLSTTHSTQPQYRVGYKTWHFFFFLAG